MYLSLVSKGFLQIKISSNDFNEFSLFILTEKVVSTSVPLLVLVQKCLELMVLELAHQLHFLYLKKADQAFSRIQIHLEQNHLQHLLVVDLVIASFSEK